MSSYFYVVIRSRGCIHSAKTSADEIKLELKQFDLDKRRK